MIFTRIEKKKIVMVASFIDLCLNCRFVNDPDGIMSNWSAPSVSSFLSLFHRVQGSALPISWLNSCQVLLLLARHLVFFYIDNCIVMIPIQNDNQRARRSYYSSTFQFQLSRKRKKKSISSNLRNFCPLISLCEVR